MSKCDTCGRGTTVICNGEEIKCCPYVNNCPFEESEVTNEQSKTDERNS